MNGLWARRGAGKMAQQLRAGTALRGDPTSVGSQHPCRVAYNSYNCLKLQFQGTQRPPWSLRASALR